MVNKSAVLLVLSVLQVVLGDFIPEPPFRILAGTFADIEKPRTGISRLDIHGEKITNITNVSNFTSGSLTIDILDGGVGYDYVSFSYEATADARGKFQTYIFTTEPTFTTDQKRSLFKDDPRDFIDFIFVYDAFYNSSNSSRTDIASFSFDKGISECNGDSLWLNGNGSREIKGGYPENYLDVVLYIPEAVSGRSFYTCVYPNGVEGSRNVGRPTSHSLQETVDAIGLIQTYYTMEYQVYGIHGSISIHFDYKIQSYEGGIDWKNGTGEWNVTAGGVGYDYIEFSYVQAAYTYGILDCNLVIV